MKNQSINRTWNAGKVSAILAIFAFASLSGCVINSSDVASVATPQQNEINRESATLEDAVTLNGVTLNVNLTPEQIMQEATRNGAAAIGEIKQGSASQSSNVGNIVGLVTAIFNDNPSVTGQIFIENKGTNPTWEMPNLDLRDGANNRGFFINHFHRNLRFHNEERTNVYAYYIDRATEEELLALQYYTDESAYDDEFITGGIWQEYDIMDDGNLEIANTGVFVDVLEEFINLDSPLWAPSIGFRTDVAEYTGWGRSIVSYSRANGDTSVVTGNRNEDVALYVNFGTEKISGTIKKVPGHFNDNTQYISEVRLKESTFDPDNRGFLSDGVAEWVWINSYTFDGEVTVTGKWGGQFYNPNAKVFAGTYGADNGEDTNILGFFGAYDKDDCTTAGGGFGTRDGDADEFNVCTPKTGSCNAGGGADTGSRDRDGNCVAYTGSCNIGSGIDNGMRDNIGNCVPEQGGSCTGSGINAGLYDSAGACVALTGACGAGVNAGVRDSSTGECISFTTATAPTADDSNPGILGSIASVIMTNSLMAALLQTKVDDAATATPQAGSMTQSSETGDRVGIADENSIIYGETGDITLAISNSGSGATWSDVSTEDADIAKSYAAADIGDFKSINLRKEIAGTGNLFVDVRTDIERTADTGTIIRGAEGSPATLSIGNTFTPLGYYTDDASTVLLDIESNHVEGIEIWIPCTGSGCQNLVEFDGVMGILAEEPCTTGCTAHGSLGDTTGASTVETGTNNLVFYPNQFETVVDIDYLVGGTWLYIPDTGGNWEIGAFADGSQKLTNDIPLRTNAIYDGKAIGLRLNNNVVSNFEGDVRLTAAFGNNAGGRGQIDGSITGSDLPAAIELDTATYDLTGNNRGIFTDGETNMEGGYTGKWGGQFYGNIVVPSSNAPSESSVSGTFGVSKGTPGDADSDSFVGFFGGTEQQ